LGIPFLTFLCVYSLPGSVLDAENPPDPAAEEQYFVCAKEMRIATPIPVISGKGEAGVESSDNGRRAAAKSGSPLDESGGFRRKKEAMI
jgi:hypothetical protein